jgi:flagellar basal-body rod modification protein FlgD
MTAIDPFADLRLPATPTTARAPDDQFGKDTFLKLLVAQLRYQNPLAPKDGSEFLAQTAQFTMVEKLSALEQQGKDAARASEVLAASTMIGRSVTFALDAGDAPVPTPTTTMSIGGTLPAAASPGTKVEVPAAAYTKGGIAVALRLELTRLPEQEQGSAWEVRAFHGTQQVGAPSTITFDEHGARTGGDLVLGAAALDTVPGTAGTWAPAGVTVAFGSALDPGRLRVAAGPATVALREQDGGDGTTLQGIVTGMRFDPIHGALLRIGTRDVPLGAVVDVRLPAGAT